MGHPRAAPRPLELEELIPVLLREHEEQRNRLTMLKEALSAGNYRMAAELVSWLHGSLSQHIVDEETQMLKVLLHAYGREGAQQAIRVFQQHRKIHKPIEEWTSAPPEFLASKKGELNGLGKLFHEHAEAEEKQVFPYVVKTNRKSLRKR